MAMTQQPQDHDSLENRYLWDGEGPLDIEVARLEQTLAPLRYQAPRSVWRPRLLAAFAVAAVAAMLALVVWTKAPQPVSSWTVARGESAAEQMRAGQVIATDSGAPARLHSPDLGSLTVEPNSRIRLLKPARGLERLALDYGVMRAFIWAPPAKFAVNTPAATAVDLGCVYTLESDRRGDGRLAVEVGWVALQHGKLEAFIPAGASCRIRHQSGPGLPVYASADEAFRSAVSDWEQGDIEKLGEALSNARPEDALTLWHLIARTEGEQRKRVVSRFTSLVEVPASLRVEDLLAAKPAAMDAAWDSLQLGSTTWWRTWKQHL